MVDTTPSRHEKSLGLLTTKFVSLLQEAKDGVLDLKVVSNLYLLISAMCNWYIFLFRPSTNGTPMAPV